MDISVLTEQRREMVINLLKGMKIRKSDGEGFDKDDVYACMQQLCDVYEKSIDDLTVSYETELSELQDKYQKYDENNDLYISLIMEAKKSSNEIINKAKMEVDEILAAGKEQIAAQEEEMERLRASAEQEKAELSAEMEAAREAALREKMQLAADVEAEKNQVASVREQYKDQIAVMDQEFDEIKTNILRTAGKIDGLKAQLEDAGEEASWQLQDEPEFAPEPEAAPEPEVPAEEMTFEQLVSKLQEEDAAKAGQVAEVEAPAMTPIVEPEVEETVSEAPLGEFSFEPVFDAPAAEEPVPEVEIPADIPVDIPADIPAEIPAEPEADGPFEEPALDIPLDDSFEGMPEVEHTDIASVDLSFDEQSAEIPADIPVDIPADIPADIPVDIPADIPVDIPAEPVMEQPVEEISIDSFPVDPVIEEAVPEAGAEELANIDELALEELSVDLPQEAPAEVAEEPIEEISFEGLEELFKE